jgi:hypothetical protein
LTAASFVAAQTDSKQESIRKCQGLQRSLLFLLWTQPRSLLQPRDCWGDWPKPLGRNSLPTRARRTVAASARSLFHGRSSTLKKAKVDLPAHCPSPTSPFREFSSDILCHVVYRIASLAKVGEWEPPADLVDQRSIDRDFP